MTDPSTDERLAALMARRPARVGTNAAQQPSRSADAGAGPNARVLSNYASDPTVPLSAVRFDPDPPLHWSDSLRDGVDRWAHSWSPSRLVASGASAVSFVAMIVAMGPLMTPDKTSTDAGAGAEGSSEAASGSQNPGAPVVTVTVDPGLATAPGAVPSQELVPLSGSAPTADANGSIPAGTPGAAVPGSTKPAAQVSGSSTSSPAPGSSATQPPATQPPATAKPGSTATQPPATQPPSTAKPGSTATQPPATQPPTTQAPTTRPPTTQAPTTTAAPTTQPPTTKAS
jgi:hypothetical protein